MLRTPLGLLSILTALSMPPALAAEPTSAEPEVLAQFPGVRSRLSGLSQMGREIQLDLLKGAALALFLIYALMAIPLRSYAQPLIIMSVIPFGVIGALSPSTNPEATPVIKSISAIKGRNSIIIAPHPRAKLTNKMIVDYMRDALERMGAPADLVIGIEVPSLELTNELMRQCDRVLATGGEAIRFCGSFEIGSTRSAKNRFAEV